MKFINFFLLLSIAIVTFSCDSDDDVVDPDKIYTRYYVQYIDNVEKTYIRAIFLKGSIAGQNVQLKGGAEIMADGIKLKNSDGDPYGYTAELIGQRETFNLVYSDSDGNRYENQIDMTEVPQVAFPGGFNNINIQEDHELNWSGPAITRNEEQVKLEYGMSGVNYYTAVADDIDEGSLTLTSRNLMSLGEGESEMILYREFQPALSSTPPPGGSLVISYSTGIVPVTLIYE